MIKALLTELENLAGSDDFEFEAEDIMNRIEEEGAGAEIIADLLGIMERHPLDDFGMPGPMVHYIERFAPDYFPLLMQSVRRAPALHTLWMLNRCINGSSDKESFISILRDTADNESLDNAIRDSAKEFLEFQS